MGVFQAAAAALTNATIVFDEAAETLLDVAEKLSEKTLSQRDAAVLRDRHRAEKENAILMALLGEKPPVRIDLVFRFFDELAKRQQEEEVAKARCTCGAAEDLIGGFFRGGQDDLDGVDEEAFDDPVFLWYWMRDTLVEALRAKAEEIRDTSVLFFTALEFH